MTIKELRLGEFFTLKDYGTNEVSEKVVWVRGEYDRSTRNYSCYKFTDVCHESFYKGDKKVFTDFIF